MSYVDAGGNRRPWKQMYSWQAWSLCHKCCQRPCSVLNVEYQLILKHMKPACKDAASLLHDMMITIDGLPLLSSVIKEPPMSNYSAACWWGVLMYLLPYCAGKYDATTTVAW
jgi:hypothetical protein